MTEEKIQFSGVNHDDDLREYRFIILPVLIFCILLLAVVLASYFNYHTYFFKISDRKLELWHGDFAPMGVEILADFESIPVSNHDFSNILNKRYQGKERAFGALYNVFIGEAAEELNNGCEADLKKVEHSMELADRFFPLCYRINPGFARTRFEVSWKKVEILKDLLSSAYQDSLEHMEKIRSMGLSNGLNVDEKEKEASEWLKLHPVSP